jgi:hypothetical protein
MSGRAQRPELQSRVSGTALVRRDAGIPERVWLWRRARLGTGAAMVWSAMALGMMFSHHGSGSGRRVSHHPFGRFYVARRLIRPSRGSVLQPWRDGHPKGQRLVYPYYLETGTSRMPAHRSARSANDYRRYAPLRLDWGQALSQRGVFCLGLIGNGVAQASEGPLKLGADVAVPLP